MPNSPFEVGVVTRVSFLFSSTPLNPNTEKNSDWVIGVLLSVPVVEINKDDDEIDDTKKEKLKQKQKKQYKDPLDIRMF